MALYKVLILIQVGKYLQPVLQKIKCFLFNHLQVRSLEQFQKKMKITLEMCHGQHLEGTHI